MRCFGDFFEKNIDVDVFDDVLQNAKHRANDAFNDVNRPPLILEQARTTGQAHRDHQDQWLAGYQDVEFAFNKKAWLKLS